MSFCKLNDIRNCLDKSKLIKSWVWGFRTPLPHCCSFLSSSSSKQSLRFIQQNHMARVIFATTFSSFPVNRSNADFRKSTSTTSGHRRCIRAMMHVEKPLEETYNVRVERNVGSERLEELGVSRWSTWKTGKCRLPWDWQVDQLVYVEEGEVRVVPEGSKRFMSFVAGDLVRYPKWFEADLYFNGPYQERYSFRAYGDD